MTLRQKLDNVESSEIFKLVFEGKILGLRIKFFNVNTEVFEYYDFNTSIISHQDVKNFLNKIASNMKSLELIRTGNGLLMTDDEINNHTVIGEFENESNAIKVLVPFIRIYKMKGVA